MDDQIPAIMEHLAKHPPDFLLQEAHLGFKTPVRAMKSARPMPKMLPTRRLKPVGKTPDSPFTKDQLDKMDRLTPGMFDKMGGRPL